MNWLVFSYSLPSKARSSPRVAVWRRLRALGAVSPKGGVYMLPDRPECAEAFQWLAQEVEHAGGEALLMHVDRFDGLADGAVVALFQDARRRDYLELDARAADLERSIHGRRAGPGDAGEALARLRREHADITRIDFFSAPESGQVAARLDRAEQRLTPARPGEARIAPAAVTAYRSARWVTRPHPHVDRLACAWLIRRFINPRAAIRYAPAARPGEVAFDMSGAEFGHRGTLCTFETMARAFRLDDAGIRAIAEIVHAIDLRDGRAARPEISGIDTVLRGWAGLPDAELERRGIAVFEGLYASLGAPLRRPAQGRPKRTSRSTARSGSRAPGR